MELLNALRRDGVLTVTADGWHWDETEVRRRLRRSEVTRLLEPRVEAMPPRSRKVLEAMACLGGRAELRLLRAATGDTADTVERWLAPALDEGLLVMEPGVRETVRFRHEQTREVVLRAMDPHRQRALRVAVARRLAGVPELFAVAAEQYLPVIDAVDGPAERHRVVGLLRRAADQAALVGDHAVVDAMLKAALRLIDPDDPDETATLVEVHTARHAALYGLGNLDDADEVFRTIERLSGSVTERAHATGVQVSSLTHRGRFAEAIRLGVESLRELGITIPAADRIPAELDRQFASLLRRLDHSERGDDVTRPEITDPVILASAQLLNAIIAAAYFAADYATYSWLSMEALRIWVELGPAPTLLGPASAACNTAVVRGNFSAAYRVGRRLVAQGAARGYEPATSHARYLLAGNSHWVEPTENGVRSCQRARQGLIAGGDLANAGYSYYYTVSRMVDCAPTLDALVAEVDAGLAFVRRTGNEQTGRVLDSYRWLVGVLRGESSDVAGGVYPIDMPMPLPAHVTRGIAAAVFDDPAALTRHSAAVMSLLTPLGPYPTDAAYVLRGLALAGQIRDSRDGSPAGLLSELDDVTDWLAARAADAPANFLHLLRLVEAERAWAVGDFRAADLAFDAALRAVDQRQRPWHRAVITEHAARFHLTQGLEHAGYSLLVEARREYLAWGATAKVDQLDWAYPTLRTQPDRTAAEPGVAPYERAVVTTGALDLLGILSASQALSSETSIGRLHSRVAHVLSAMTGATDVYLLLWSADRQDWLRPATGGDAVALDGAGRDGAAPMSVVRYAQRMREPLVVSDATRDDRFARDPYFAGVPCCSLLAVPILSRGTLQAMLLLENRLIRGAFTTERLDAVKLIAGQLVVSLDNVQLYAEFRRIADEQAALRRVATLVARGTGPELVFAAVADEVGTLVGADDTAIVRFEPDGDATVMGRHGSEPTRPGSRGKPDAGSAMAAVQATGRAARRDVRAPAPASPAGPGPAGLRSVVAGPILVEGRVWGAMTVGSRYRRLPPDTEQRLADFTELVATAIANAESRAELTTSRARLVAAADQARRRIERDLHDGAQQRLVTLALQLRTAQAALPPELDTISAELDRAVTGAAGALDELREISRGIHPAILSEGGLGPALRSLARRSPIPADLDMAAMGRLPDQVEVSAYYVVAEALTNAAKHAHASAATVTVEAVEPDTADAVLRVAVRDDGVGGADFTRGTGLLGLKDRVEALGGRIVLDSPRGTGTTLSAEFPLTSPVPR
ncbi:GAF domain-containing protein [Dactylosporangium roseum]|uniref:GAF domain-containing protein n=1 Tax=Dactylosporangium roseum TaxID=47989 RepID=A0ABY5YVU5_9ACTN|nr:GAF domain-containing protein [Dactylosporangium roseum]UWZ33865.1 GAF domain-containing protein [Dactylosporangium roseum]